MEPVVRFEKVSKRFGEDYAVRDLDLSIEPGRFVTLLGPSGCGKSTTLRMLGGFEMPSSGRILLAGEDVTRKPPYRRDVNMVFQDYALFPHMTVAENIAFGLELKGLSKEATAARVRELLGLVRLEGYADRAPQELSGGQRQRVALVRALAPDPRVLLLDEPLSALDAKLRQQMQIELKAMQEETGKSFLFVTHDQEEALTMSDVVVVMNEGRIEQMGTPDELYRQPRSRFVASFIGSSNLLDCTVERAEGERVALSWDGIPFHASTIAGDVAQGGSVNVALRPEVIRCHQYEPHEGNRLKGTIRRRIFKGASTSLLVEATNNRTIEAAVDPLTLDRLSGEQVWLSFDSDRAVVLQD